MGCRANHSAILHWAAWNGHVAVADIFEAAIAKDSPVPSP
jgi:hypothetical protein